MSLYSSAVKNPISTLMIFVGVIVMGIYSIFYIPIDLLPEMEIPSISVITFYPGASAEDIEVNVTKPIENQLNALQNLKKVTSSSKDNISFVTCEFEYGINLDEASNDVRDAVSIAEKSLPDGCEKPSIFKFSSSMVPVVIYGIQADRSYAALEKLIDEKIIEKLSRIDGVGSVTIIGKPIRIIDVTVDPRKLDAYNITLEQVGAVIGAENISLPAGRIEVGRMEFPVRTNGEFRNSDVVKSLVVANNGGKLVYMKDIATVKDTLKSVLVDERIDGSLGVRLMVQKQSGANTVKIARLVRESMDELQKDLPSDVKVVKIIDSSEFIQNSINNLSETLIYAFVFITLVVILFLGRWRSTFIIMLTIPISLVGAFIYLFISGNSINIVSLSALSIAIGMVVDDAIVVLENITTHIERGSSPMEAAVFATREVGLAVIATTLVIVAVFMPLTLIGGLIGVFFRQLGWIVTITVSLSTLAALSLTPMLSSRILKGRSYYKHHRSRFLESVNRFWGFFDTIYVKSLAWTLKHKALTLIIAGLVFIGSLGLAGVVGTEFLPSQDNGRINVNMEIPQGIRIDEAKALARDFEQKVKKKYPEVTLISTSIGADEGGSLKSIFQKSASYIINYSIMLTSADDRTRSIFEIADSLRKDITGYTQVTSSYVDPGGNRNSRITLGMGGGSNLEVKILGYDINQTNYIAEQIAGTLEAEIGFRDISISRDKDRMELQVIPDREKLAQLGLNTSMLASAVRNRIYGLTATKYREEGTEYDVILKYNDANLTSVSDIENITFKGPMGNMVRVGDVAQIKQVYTTPNLEHEDKIRVVKVVSALSGIDLGTASSIINAKLATLTIPDNVIVEIGGAAKDMADTFQDLKLLFVLIMVLTYLVMAAQFESLREPFIIMFSVPFALTGVFISLYVTGTTLNMISGIAIVMLVGIAVKNSIVLVDFINLLVSRGRTISQAILEGGKSRLRPILMTSFTTLLGMLPMALSKSEGSEIWRPLGISIVGGLVFSMLISLVIVPIIYALFANARIKRERKKLQASDSEISFDD